METIRKIKIFKTYFKEFYIAQTNEVKDKIDYVLSLIKSVERVPTTYLKQIEGVSGLYEIRVQYAGNIYRIFCCNDKGIWLFCSTAFRRRRRKLPPMK